MWRHRSWTGRYLPRGAQPSEDLAAYATWCTAVEGNTTFYALPDPGTVERWRDATPERFRFLFKVPRAITHDRRLRDSDELLAEFCDRIRPLGSRVGPISIQLPGSFGPRDLPDLEEFLALVPDDLPWSVEVRHPELHEPGPAQQRLNDLLHDRGSDRVVLDTRALFAGPWRTAAEIEAWERKPRLPVRPVVTGNRPVVRFIGQTEADANPEYWAPWVERVSRWLHESKEPTVFVHTPDNAISPDLARRFHAEVTALQPTLRPLPVPLPLDDQVRMFDP